MLNLIKERIQGKRYSHEIRNTSVSSCYVLPSPSTSHNVKFNNNYPVVFLNGTLLLAFEAFHKASHTTLSFLFTLTHYHSKGLPLLTGRQLSIVPPTQSKNSSTSDT